MNPFQNIYKNIDLSKMRLDLKERGWFILGSIETSDYLSDIRADIDQMAEQKDTEINYHGSEHRVWKAHNKSDKIEEFRKFSDEVVSDLIGKPHAAYDILAIRNRVIDREKKILQAGRWHLDSFNRQIKVFAFLSDVTKDSGPFEMLPGTHVMHFKLKEAFKGKLITPADLINGSRQYSKLDDEIINSFAHRGFETKAFLVPAGTLALVDTSCVHRARPCIDGERYALTSYYH